MNRVDSRPCLNPPTLTPQRRVEMPVTRPSQSLGSESGYENFEEGVVLVENVCPRLNPPPDVADSVRNVEPDSQNLTPYSDSSTPETVEIPETEMEPVNPAPVILSPPVPAPCRSKRKCRRAFKSIS